MQSLLAGFWLVIGRSQINVQLLILVLGSVAKLPSTHPDFCVIQIKLSFILPRSRTVSLFRQFFVLIKPFLLFVRLELRGQFRIVATGFSKQNCLFQLVGLSPTRDAQFQSIFCSEVERFVMQAL